MRSDEFTTPEPPQPPEPPVPPVPLPEGTDLRPLQLSLEPASDIFPDTPVVFNLVIENYGTEVIPANFWVDVYINPATPPTSAGSFPGADLAWQVTRSLAPGEQLTLSSDLSDPFISQIYSFWFSQPFNGSFLEPGEQTLWAYVDAWNGPDDPDGFITERDEGNNRLGPITVTVLDNGTDRAEAPSGEPAPVPIRPVP